MPATRQPIGKALVSPASTRNTPMHPRRWDAAALAVAHRGPRQVAEILRLT